MLGYDAWQNIVIDFDRFMAVVRKKLGKGSCCRVYEAYQNDHTHIHCILLFEETEFKVFRDKKVNFESKKKRILQKAGIVTLI